MRNNGVGFFDYIEILAFVDFAWFSKERNAMGWKQCGLYPFTARVYSTGS